MIDIKPPEGEILEGHFTEEQKQTCLDYVRRKGDLQKFMVLFDQVGIEYEMQGNELWIDAHYSDGKDGFIVKFYDDHSFKEFDYIGMNKSDLHEISKTLKDILREMRKRK